MTMTIIMMTMLITMIMTMIQVLQGRPRHPPTNFFNTSSATQIFGTPEWSGVASFHSGNKHFPLPLGRGGDESISSKGRGEVFLT